MPQLGQSSCSRCGLIIFRRVHGFTKCAHVTRGAISGILSGPGSFVAQNIDDTSAAWLPARPPPALWLPSQKGQANWVNLRNMLFNLEMNDSVLAEQFLGEIERLRKIRKIGAPKKGAGVRRKLVSFLPIELMDRSFFLKTKLDGSQRSQVSKAQQSYVARCKELKLAP